MSATVTRRSCDHNPRARGNELAEPMMMQFLHQDLDWRKREALDLMIHHGVGGPKT